MMKTQDRSIKTIVCGSSGPFMKTFPAWDRHGAGNLLVARRLPLAAQLRDQLGQRHAGFLAYSVEFEKHIDTLETVLRETKQKVNGKHDIYLSQDEWNVWYKDRNGDGKWTIAPHLCEEPYNLEDALVVAQWMNVFLRKCHVVKMACLAQVVNVIAPLKTRGRCAAQRIDVLSRSSGTPTPLAASRSNRQSKPRRSGTNDSATSPRSTWRDD
jgi:alpha-N-arabinofuranosidase